MKHPISKTTQRLLRDTEVLEDPTPRLLLIGVDHRCAPIELREKVAYGPEEGPALLARLREQDAIMEASLLSTCNRTEVYLRPRQEAEAYREGMRMVFLDRAPQVEAEGRFYAKRDEEAARHLFEVASGLQSMVLGEPEILGQVKRAAGWSQDHGTGGTILQKMLRSAIATGGRVRQETAIGSGAVSFGYAVVDLARNIFHRLEDCSVLIVGAGETGRQVARNLKERGAKELWVTNRSPQRAEEFCRLFPDARNVPFDQRQKVMAECDVVVASTAAEEPVLVQEDFRRAMSRRRSRPLLVADLGVPRNIDPGAGHLENLFLQDIDSLEQLISQNLRRRREEIPRVHEIIDRELEHFDRWCQGLAVEPVISRLQKRAELMRQQEIAEVLERFPPETHDHLDRLTKTLVRKLLHHPSRRLRGAESVEIIETVRDLFQLDDLHQVGPSRPKGEEES